MNDFTELQVREWNPQDKLNRKEDSRFLSEYLINKFDSEKDQFDSFVLNINAKWGFGKTYFLDNWCKDLLLNNFPVVFFNAWESDYYQDPLLAFIYEINNQIEKFISLNDSKTKSTLKKTKDYLKKVLTTGGSIAVSTTMKHLANLTTDQVSAIWNSASSEETDGKSNKELGNAVAKITQKTIDKTLEEYKQSQKNIVAFKDNLSKLIDNLNTDYRAPLFIFIDELDRCRPTYAIEVLEKIKHIFNVPGVYFIIATASEQLCHSIKSIYGQGFDAEGYLQRFFYQSYEFAEPDYYNFANYLFEKIKIDDHREKLFSPSVDKNEVNPNIKLFASYSELFDLGLRAQEQIAVNLYTICLTWKEESPAKKIHLGLLLFLLIIRQKNNNGLEEILKEINIPQKKSQLTAYNYVKKELFFDDRRQTDTFNSKPVTEKISNIIKRYIDLIGSSSRNFTQISNQETGLKQFEITIHRQILSEITRSTGKDTDFHNFKNYFKIVKQIGQLK